MRGTSLSEFQVAHAKLSTGICFVGKWVCERSSVGSKREQVMISNRNGDEPVSSQRKPDTCLGNRTDLSPRVRACRGFNSTAPPTSPASQNLKLLGEGTGWIFVAGNTKTSPV